MAHNLDEIIGVSEKSLRVTTTGRAGFCNNFGRIRYTCFVLARCTGIHLYLESLSSVDKLLICVEMLQLYYSNYFIVSMNKPFRSQP